MFSYIAWPSWQPGNQVFFHVAWSLNWFSQIQAAVPQMPKTTITSAASLMSDPAGPTHRRTKWRKLKNAGGKNGQDTIRSNTISITWQIQRHRDRKPGCGCTMRCWSDPKKTEQVEHNSTRKKWDTLKGDNVMWVSGGGPFLRSIWNFLKLDCASELLRFDALTTEWSVESCPCCHSPWNF